MTHHTGALITGIGSLPHRDAAEAVDFIAGYAPEIPFWPQLPQTGKHELMLNQALFGLGDVYTLDQDEPAPRTDDVDRLCESLAAPPADFALHAAGWKEFLNAADAGRFTAARALKGQLCGPATLAMRLKLNGIPFCDNPRLLDALTRRVKSLIVQQAEALRRINPNVIIQLDEPLLEQAPKQAREALWDCIVCIHESLAESMVHCCSRIENNHLLECGADILSLDVYTFPPSESRLAALERHLEKGRRIAWGAVPTRRKPSLIECRTRADRWWSQLGGHHRLASSSYITAGCGLAFSDGYPPARSFRLCRELAAMMSE